jgi:hypothetical protein
MDIEGGSSFLRGERRGGDGSPRPYPAKISIFVYTEIK